MASQCPQCGHVSEPEAKFCVSCGYRLRKDCSSCSAVIEATARFCSSCGAEQFQEQSPAPAAPVEVPKSSAEYRQVTVMFLDMVGSTALAGRFDPEDWHELILAFQGSCVAEIERFGGQVACYMGDGMMVYFGYPIAQEDAPERAGLAGLAILSGLEGLNQRFELSGETELKIRIGIHVGQVVASEMGAGATREALGVVGVTPSMAARLESAAPTNGILVSEAFKKRVAQAFDFSALGPRNLKGIGDDLQVFELTGRKVDSDVFEASDRAEDLTGRLPEIGSLLSFWQEVGEKRRMGLASIEGEPGVGKSGLFQLFRSHAQIPAENLSVFSCSRFASDTPLAPLFDRLSSKFGLDADDALQDIEAKVIESLGETFIDSRDNLDALVTFLASGAQDKASVHESDSGDGKALRLDLFRAFTQILNEGPAPQLVILEDAHWADPSTIEFFDKLIRQGANRAIMILVLSRPRTVYPWRSLVQVDIKLSGLPAGECEKVVRRLCGGLAVEGALMERILEITDGIPLFVKEFTKAMLESGQIIERRGRMGFADEVVDLSAPGSLLDLLTVRLDRLGSARDVAQTAAVVGRDFSQAPLEYMSNRSSDDISECLSTLIHHEMIGRVAGAQGEKYQFSHALFQKVAYDSLLRKDRQRLHKAYLDWLDHNPVAKMSLRPEQLAYHCELAGRRQDAISLWIAAGEAATSTSASQEAVHHFEAGLRLIRLEPETSENRTILLRLLVLLGGAQLMSKGPGAPETRASYAEALKLCEELPETPWHFPAYWGWWRISENFSIMLEQSRRLLKVAETMREPEFHLQAHHCHWVNAFLVGEHDSCLTHANKGLEIYHQGDFAEMGSMYGGHDPKVCGLGEQALSLWVMGRADESLVAMADCRAWAEELGHLGSWLHALDIELMLHHYRRDVETVAGLAVQVRDMGLKNELDDYLAKADIFEGWCVVERGNLEDGGAQLENGLAAMRQVGTREDFPVYFAMVAELRMKKGAHVRAGELLKEGLRIIEEEGVTYWASEIYRLLAQCHLDMSFTEPAMPQSNALKQEVETLLTTAIDLARAQRAFSLELRASLSMARYHAQVGETAAGHALLRQALEKVQQGWDTRDLLDASAALDSLRRRVNGDVNELT
ncbi:MAG: adenylate/guanylate cyclase domain-containing protein [Pseudomonadota bacterium]